MSVKHQQFYNIDITSLDYETFFFISDDFVK
jgi:hypothetical protein